MRPRQHAAPVNTLEVASSRAARHPIDRPSQTTPALTPAPARLEAIWARHLDEVRAAQKLRWQVFVDEMGARLTTPPGIAPGHDVDLFDDHCEHLLVRAWPADGSAPQVVGTYRVMTPTAARLVGGFYTETEFDLTRLRGQRQRMAELGRSCVAAEWRHGGVILALWGALAAFMQRNGLDTVVGCASVPMRDGGHYAASLWTLLSATHLAPIDVQVRPRSPLPVQELRCDLRVEPPALIKGYLKCGGKLLGPPAWDPDFQTADLPMMLRLDEMSPAYRRRLMNAA